MTNFEQLNKREPSAIERVYVGSPVKAPTREGVKENIIRALYACRLLVEEGYAPIAPHVQYLLILDEMDAQQRELGIRLDLALMEGCSRVILFTEDGTAQTLSNGMMRDVKRAEELGLSVEYRHFPALPVNCTPHWLTLSLTNSELELFAVA